MVDHFQLKGPNDTDGCLVLELPGEDVPGLFERRIGNERIPAQLAILVAK